MSRILLFIISALSLFLLIDIVAIWGIGRLVEKLKLQETAREIREDVLVLQDIKSIPDSTFSDCMDFEITELTLPEKEEKTVVEEKRSKTIKSALDGAQCYDQYTRHCLRHAHAKTIEALWGYVECIRIAGRQMDYQFSPAEVNYYGLIKSWIEEDRVPDDLEGHVENSLEMYNNTIMVLRTQFRATEQIMKIH